MPSELGLRLLVNVNLMLATQGHLANGLALEGALLALLLKGKLLAVNFMVEVGVNFLDLFALLVVHVIFGFLYFFETLLFLHEVGLGLLALHHFLRFLIIKNLGVVTVVDLFALNEFVSFLTSVFDFLICFLLFALEHGHAVPQQLNILLDLVL